jgi:hypothetical protein
MKHIIITRCNFKDEFLFQKYFEVMKRAYIPSVINQSCKDFKLFIHTNKELPHHLELIREQFSGSDVDLDLKLTGFKEYVVREKYNIQTRHDCDDFMYPNYIEAIHDMYDREIKNHDEFLIHAQPTKLNFYTMVEYFSGTYKPTSTSMFLSLCQKNVSKNILQEQHSKFPSIVPNVFSLGTGFVKLIIHDNNKLSKIKPNDKKIGPTDIKM